MTVISCFLSQIFSLSHAPLAPMDLPGCIATKGGLFVIAVSLIVILGKTR